MTRTYWPRQYLWVWSLGPSHRHVANARDTVASSRKIKYKGINWLTFTARIQSVFSEVDSVRHSLRTTGFLHCGVVVGYTQRGNIDAARMASFTRGIAIVWGLKTERTSNRWKIRNLENGPFLYQHIYTCSCHIQGTPDYTPHNHIILTSVYSEIGLGVVWARYRGQIITRPYRSARWSDCESGNIIACHRTGHQFCVIKTDACDENVKHRITGK